MMNEITFNMSLEMATGLFEHPSAKLCLMFLLDLIIYRGLSLCLMFQTNPIIKKRFKLIFILCNVLF